MKTTTLRVLACLLVLVGAASPVQADPRVMLLVDNSGSMRANDAERLVPDAVQGFVQALPAGAEVSVVAFDQRARLLSPLQDAARFDLATLRSLDYSGQLTDPAAAVERALYTFRQNGAEGSRDAIVLLTDGVVDLGSPELDRRSEDWLLGPLQASLVDEGISVWAIALTEAADFRILYRLTNATGGSYFRVENAADVRAVTDRVRAQIMASSATTAAVRPAATERVANANVANANVANANPADEPAAVQTATPPAARVATPEPAPAASAEPAVEENTTWLWTIALLLLGSGVGLLVWVGWRTLYAEVAEAPAPPEPLEYFPECYLVDLQGVTDHPSHRLAGKYNMITRLQHPPDDGMHYIQVFRRQIGRRHALIEYRDFAFWVVDQNSVNGTYLNGKRVVEETRLKHGDRLRFHIYEFEFCVSDLALSNETLAQEATEVAGGMRR